MKHVGRNSCGWGADTREPVPGGPGCEAVWPPCPPAGQVLTQLHRIIKGSGSSPRACPQKHDRWKTQASVREGPTGRAAHPRGGAGMELRRRLRYGGT